MWQQLGWGWGGRCGGIGIGYQVFNGVKEVRGGVGWQWEGGVGEGWIGRWYGQGRWGGGWGR